MSTIQINLNDTFNNFNETINKINDTANNADDLINQVKDIVLRIIENCKFREAESNLIGKVDSGKLIGLLTGINDRPFICCKIPNNRIEKEYEENN